MSALFASLLRSSVLAAGALAAALLLPAAARAELITWTFTAHVTTGFGNLGGTPVDSLMGAPMTAVVRFEYPWPDAVPNSVTGEYHYTNPPYSFTIQIGDLLLPGPPEFRIGVTNDWPTVEFEDALVIYRAVSTPFPGVPGLFVDGFEVGLYDISGDAFESDALFTEPLPFDVFDADGVYIAVNGCTAQWLAEGFCLAHDFALAGRLETWTVPEPGAGAPAALLALAGVAARRHRSVPRGRAR